MLKIYIRIEKLQNNITSSQKYPKYDQHPDFKIRDEALLDTLNIHTGKLDEQRVVLFKISWVDQKACILEEIAKGYNPTFYLSLLEKYNRGKEVPPLVKLLLLKQNQ